MTAGGHGVDAADLTSAGEFVRTQAVDQVSAPLMTVENVAVAAQDFGREHTHQCERYQAGIDRLVAMVKGYLRVCDDFGDRLGGASGQYESMESDTEHSVGNQHGSLGDD